jgi:hypothetical protein
MMGGLRALLLFAAGVGACQSRTTVKVDISAPGLSILSLKMDVAWDGQTHTSTSLPPAGGPPQLPGSVILVLPDMSKEIDVQLTATDSMDAVMVTKSSVQCRAHSEASLAMMLAPETPGDLPLADLTLPSTTDLAGADSAVSVDGASDFAGAPPDMEHVDLENPDLEINPLVQLGALAVGTNMVNASLNQPSRAGTLLVFTLAWDKAGLSGGPADAGWTYWNGNKNATAEVWFRANNAGGYFTVSSTLTGATAGIGQLSEWTGFTMEDVGVWNSNTGPSSSLTMTTTMVTTHKVLGIASFAELFSSASTATLSPGSGWSLLGENDSSTVKLHAHFTYQLGLPSGAAVTDTVTSTVSGTWAGAMVTFY